MGIPKFKNYAKQNIQIPLWYQDISTIALPINLEKQEADPELNNNNNNNKQKKVYEKRSAEKDCQNNKKWNGLRRKKKRASNLETGAYSWLTILPVKEEGYILNTQSFLEVNVHAVII